MFRTPLQNADATLTPVADLTVLVNALCTFIPELFWLIAQPMCRIRSRTLVAYSRTLVAQSRTHVAHSRNLVAHSREYVDGRWLRTYVRTYVRMLMGMTTLIKAVTTIIRIVLAATKYVRTYVDACGDDRCE